METLVTTNYQPWIFAFSVFQFLCNAAVGIYVWWVNRDKVTNSRFKEIENRIAKVETGKAGSTALKGMEDRVVKVEAKVQSRPVCGHHARMESNDVKLFERFDELHGDLRGVAGELKSLVGAVNMINEHLINGRK
jgi:hypothetical protein